MANLLNYIAIFVTFLHFSSCRIGFIKDQDLESIPFPPKYVKLHTDIQVPMGHMRPLGYQRPPEGRVAEEDEPLYPRDFHDKYVSPGRPVVFRKAIDDVPAMTKWKKDDYLKKTYGNIDLHVVVKKELFKQGPKVMSMKSFIREYNFDDWYLTNIIPREMMGELVFPKLLKCGMDKFLQQSEIWMSSGGTASLLHSHADHTLHCVLTGKKNFILVEPKYRDKVYYHKSKEIHFGEGHSDIPDMDRINMYKYKELFDVPWTWASLYGGDCMYIPAAYMHQVRAYGRSFSSTTLWAPSPEVDFSDCPSHDEMDKVTPLADAPFIWTYLKADRELANIQLDAESMKHHLIVWIRNEKSLRYDVLKDYYDEIMSELAEADKPAMSDIWQTLTGSSDKSAISREAVKSLSSGVLQQVAEYLNRPHALHDHGDKPATNSTQGATKQPAADKTKGRDEL